MSRAFSLVFAILCYAIFFATFLYLIVFVGDLALGSLAPKTVDDPPGTLSVAAAVITDIALIALFGVQHSVMARQGFKRAWMKIVPPPVERSLYVLLASLVLLIMFRFWQPIDAVVWSVRNPIVHDLLFGLFWIGWLTVLVSTFLINHFELFGLQQAWFHVRGRAAEPPRFQTPLFYKWVRHPLYLGFFLAFWATPEMTAGHLLLAAGMSVYMVIAIRYEERDLVAFHGRDYLDYRGRVGMLMPRFRSRA
ncbi:MAG TPA: isoprenylcysteine carboxylmethyltransferase family protein [Sphingomicrobium sp.]|nr:isoprenylcysteine carboxylmethyltransferase family protein [Sphingomicrobium sp.]